MPPHPPAPQRPGNCKGNNGTSHQEDIALLQTRASQEVPASGLLRWGRLPRKGKVLPTSEVQVNTPEMSCPGLWKSSRGSCFLWEEHTVRGKQAEIYRTPGSAAGTTASSPDVISMNTALSQGKIRCFKSEWTWPVSTHTPDSG